MLKNDPKKLETFSNFVSEYKNGVQTARELCDSVCILAGDLDSC